MPRTARCRVGSLSKRRASRHVPVRPSRRIGSEPRSACCGNADRHGVRSGRRSRPGRNPRTRRQPGPMAEKPPKSEAVRARQLPLLLARSSPGAPARPWSRRRSSTGPLRQSPCTTTHCGSPHRNQRGRGDPGDGILRPPVSCQWGHRAQFVVSGPAPALRTASTARCWAAIWSSMPGVIGIGASELDGQHPCFRSRAGP
jgi:hypothetical protein